MALFLQSGQVRLVSKVTESCRSGSIHKDVPVYPRWPNELAEKYFPDCDGGDGVSHPSARDVPDGDCSLRVKRANVSGRRIGCPPFNMTCAKIAISSALEKRPACPATPPSALVFSS